MLLSKITNNTVFNKIFEQDFYAWFPQNLSDKEIFYILGDYSADYNTIFLNRRIFYNVCFACALLQTKKTYFFLHTNVYGKKIILYDKNLNQVNIMSTPHFEFNNYVYEKVKTNKMSELVSKCASYY